MADPTPTNQTNNGNRLAKVIARAGLCSRRQAEGWISEGRVSVNGKQVRTPAFNVTDEDNVVVDGKPLAQRSGTRMWLYHKPIGLVVTENDPEGRDTIFEALETHGLPRVLTVGRLDINTEGLLLLTNDGGLKRVLELPSTGWLRRYRVRAHGSVTQEQLDRLKKGIEVDGIKYGPIDAELERIQGANVWLQISLREGKNREIKNVLLAMGLQVNRLIRTSYGPFQLGDIPIGAVSVVRAKVLRDQLGTKLAKEAGVDFESPLPADAEPEEVLRNPNQRIRRVSEGVVERAPRPRPRGRTGAVKAEDAEKAPKVRKKAPERKGNFIRPERPPREEKPVEKRTAHFGGGRGAVEFEPKAKRKKSDDDRGGFKRGGDRDERPRRDRPDSDRPARGPHRDEGRSFGDKPRGGRSQESSGRPPRRDGPPKRDAGPGGGRGGPRSGGGKPSGPPRSGGPRKGPPRGRSAR